LNLRWQVWITCGSAPGVERDGLEWEAPKMPEIEIDLSDEEMEALRQASARPGRTVSELIREAVWEVWLRPGARGPVALWDGVPRRMSTEHDETDEEIHGRPHPGRAAERSAGRL
jgi:hypothetical protein